MKRRLLAWFVLVMGFAGSPAIAPAADIDVATNSETRVNSTAQAPVPSSAEMTARIDELLVSKLDELGWQPADASDDASFYRRLHLDLTGNPPAPSEVLDFLEQDNASKDAEHIDRLLRSPLSATHLGDQWAEWMLPENNANPFFQQDRGLQNWLRDRFAQNLRYDRLVSDLLVATGPAQGGPTGFFVALEAKPEKIAAKTARVFMGVQLDCAECHDHPFDEWSQKDFWGFAAYFAQLSAGGDPNMMRVQGITDTGEGEVMLPGTEEVVPPKPLVATGAGESAFGTRRQQLTLWLTTRENPFLARATVNRVWALLFGQGLIEPIDDMRSLDIASHPQLLRELSEYFANTDYDLRNLIATLTKTKAYRRDTKHLKGEPPEASYATMRIKPLTERQLENSVRMVARQIASTDQAGQNALANQLGRLRGDASEAKLGIVSALVMLHGDLFDQVSREESSRLLVALNAPFMNERKQLKWLFLSTLGRLPTQQEEAAFSGLFGQKQSQASAAEEATDDSESELVWQSDLLWALLNSTEFAMTP